MGKMYDRINNERSREYDCYINYFNCIIVMFNKTNK